MLLPLSFDGFPNMYHSYVSTVGLNEATIKKYIREQEKQDMLEDKLTTKEYDDPFKGSR